MAKLTTSRRNSLPKSEFGEPGKRAFPMPDRSHAANAKARATQAVNAGRMSRSTEEKIDAKANRILGEKKGKTMESKREREHAEKKGMERHEERRERREEKHRGEHHEHHHKDTHHHAHTHHHVHHEQHGDHHHTHHHGADHERKAMGEHLKREAHKVKET